MSFFTSLRKLKKNATKILSLLVCFALILVIYSNIRYDMLVSRISIMSSKMGYFDPSLPAGIDCYQVKEHNITQYLIRYPHMLDCKNEYNKWSPGQSDPDPKYNYSKAADKQLHNYRITRAIIFYFPIDKSDYFKYEFLWVYRSWINMIRYEPAKWRTDIVFFTNYKSRKVDNPGKIKSDFLKFYCIVVIRLIKQIVK